MGRLLKPTSANRAHIKDPILSSRTSEPSMSTASRTRKSRGTTTIPQNDRLLQPTKAAIARSKKEPSVSSSISEADKILSPDERKEAKARIRARMQMSQKQKESVKVEKSEKSKRAKAAVQRARGSRERLEQMENERVAKLKAKIMAKDERLHNQMERRKQRQGHQNDWQKEDGRLRSEPMRSSSRRRPRPTIPVAPKFATDSRIQKKDPRNNRDSEEEDKPLAVSVDIFGRGLRAPLPKQPQSSRRRTLTIPEAPKFATAERHAGKASITSPQKAKISFADDASWFSTLRDGNISPISKTASSVRSGPLTIPQTPKFQPIRQRPLPKSTAEKEREEMEYFRNHPFRAKPVKMNPLPPASLGSKKVTAPPRRPLTTPEPFHFRLDERVNRSHEHEEGDDSSTEQFKARPMPDFSSKHMSPQPGFPSPSEKHLTHPEPFKFQTDKRA